MSGEIIDTNGRNPGMEKSKIKTLPVQEAFLL